MVKEKEIKKTYYSLDIKNPYCGKGEFAWKHNDDSKIGDLDNETIHKRLEERKQKNDAEGKWNHKDKIYKGLLNELGRRHGVNK